MEILSTIGTIVTIETRIREFISNTKKRNNEKDIENIEEDIRECLNLDDDILDKVDDFISKHAALFKDNEKGVFFSTTDKEKFIQDFFSNNGNLYLYKKDITCALNIYIDEIEARISKVLSPSEKVIMRTINESKQSIQDIDEKVDRIINIINKKKYGEKVFLNSKYNKACIVLLKEIDAMIEKNVGKKIIKKSIPENFLEADKLENTIFKLQEIFGRIDIDYINDKLNMNLDDGFDAFIKYVKAIAPDFMASISEKYDQKINMVLYCINEFEEKSKKYYLSLGALGLINDNSDETIYLCVMDILFSYFGEIRNGLYEKWKNRNPELLKTVAQIEMQKRLWQQIRFSITDTNREWILCILNTGSISDIDLAQRYSVEVKEVRKGLYDATKYFLCHSYVDDYTTMMAIHDVYREIIKSKLEGANNEN